VNRRRLAVALAFGALFVLAIAGIAFARPGGGDSYSGGGGHGGGGDGEGWVLVFELIFHLIRLCFYAPEIGLPLLAIVIGIVIYASIQRARNKDWDSGPPVALQRAIDLQKLRQTDPDFSQVVFEDFAFRLFGTAQRARATDAELETVAPYVAPPARKQLASRTPGEPVESVVVGAMRIFRLDLPEPFVDEALQRVRIGIEFEANVTTRSHTYFSVESWLFGRAASARTKPPDPARRFPCPNCGAPWEAKATGTQQCSYCNEIVDNGRFDWVVENIMAASIDERPPTVTVEVPERGTDLATYMQPDFDQRWVGLMRDDPQLTDTAFLDRVRTIYRDLYAAWATNDLSPARGLVSDGLYDYLSYWIDAYKKQGLRNELVDMRITHTTMCKLVRDRWYDALTVRIWGKGKDFVVRDTADGDVVRGSRFKDRAYSEYWTLIRSATRRGPARADDACPNCGAPRAVNMAGACTHCNAHVTAGEFDWVLSKIEQDDSYRG
jgi:hypothetical protein